MGGFHSNAHNSSKNRSKRLNQKQSFREFSGAHLCTRLIHKYVIMKSDRGSSFEKFTNAKLLGSHCIPHKSCRKSSGGHFATRIFVLVQSGLESSKVHFNRMFFSLAFRFSCLMTVGT
eukprot:sb/3476378/